MAKKPKLTSEIYAKHFVRIGSKAGVARELGYDERNLRRFVKSHEQEIDYLIGIYKKDENLTRLREAPEVSADSDSNIGQRILKYVHVGMTLKELAGELSVSERVISAYIGDLVEQGYNIEEYDGIYTLRRDIDLERKVYELNWKGERIIRFGLCGDNQENSKYTQITHLHTFYDLLVQEGITAVYHTGDIDEGEDMRQGHKYECYSQGADDHVANIVKNYPQRDGINTYFITGNHDWSILKKVGYDIGVAISAKRPDMKYLGQGSAVINLTPNCTLELRHPGDGTAYAISYKPQKMIEAISGGEKPNILAIGHYHKAEYIMYRNVHCFQTGCFQAQTPWMKGKGIAAHMGGWIVEVHVGEEGTITRCKNEFIPFYRAIKDDYKNWQ